MASRDDTADMPGAGSVDPKDHPPIALPDEDWAWFCERCAALALPDPGPLRQRLEALFGHLVGVNRWLNLTTVSGARDWLKLHVLDSLTGLSDTRLQHLAEGAPCVDLGSGGGYPGLPLALVSGGRVPWVLADARRKKAEFLAAAGTLIGPQVRGLHLRGSLAASAAPELHRRCQLVVNRAMGQADEVLAEAAPLLRPHGHLLIWKGPAFEGQERDRAAAAAPKLGYRVVGVRRLTLVAGDPERVLACYERTA
jgi:16S rRNA (guanine527-N7)-methyltransferase